MRCNRLILVLWLGFVMSPQSSEAQSPFAGTWKIDPSRTSFPTAPEIFLLKRASTNARVVFRPSP
jgi:hypothetical protein